MESSKDIINQILQEQTDKEKINIATSKKLMKFKGVCCICNKEFEYESEAERWGAALHTQYYCSDKCRQVRREREYQKRLRVLPLKFRDIECDKKELINQGKEQSLFITGDSGVGKTVLMAGIVKELLKDKENKVKWISYSSFIMELQSMFRKEGETTPFEMSEEVATYPGTLCIDDIGSEKMTAFVQQVTYYIINYREQEMLHTLITSNFSLQQIDEQIDSRVSSRIGGMCKIIKLTGKDRRLEK